MTTGCRLAWLFGEGEAGGGAGLDGVGLLAAEEGGAVVLVALRIAAGEGERERRRRAWRRRRRPSVQEVEEVVGILAGGVEADDEVERAVALGDAFEALAEGA